MKNIYNVQFEIYSNLEHAVIGGGDEGVLKFIGLVVEISQMEISIGTLPEVGFPTQKVGRT